MFLATERGLSNNYQLLVRRNLEKFSNWLNDIKQLDSITTDDLSEYLSKRKNEGLAASSIRQNVVSLKIFFRFLCNNKILSEDIAEELFSPKPEQLLPKTINQKDVKQLLESIETSDPLGMRDRALIELLYSSGLRLEK